MNDETLLNMLRNNTDKGIAQVINLYGNGVYTICKNILGTDRKEDIEEAVADTFIKFWKLRNQIDVKISSIKTYLYTIARNVSIDMYRKNIKRDLHLELNEMIIDENMDVESEVCRRMNENFIHDALEEMEEPDRTILIMRYIYSFKVREIADKLKMSEDAVESRIRRGLRKLGKELSKKGIIIVVFLSMMLPVCIYGVVKLKQYSFHKTMFTDYCNIISVENTNNDENPYYKLNIDLPAEYEYSEILDKYYCNNRITGNAIALKLFKVDADKDWIENQVSNCEECLVAGQSAYLLEEVCYDMDNNIIDGQYKLYMFYDDEGYVVCVTGSARIGKETFIKYCNTISLEPCNLSEASEEQSLSQAMLSAEEFRQELDQTDKAGYFITGDIIRLSEWKKYDTGFGNIEFRIQKMDVLDHTRGLDRENFFCIYSDCTDYDVFEKLISESGQFQRINRLHIPKTDGIDTIARADRSDLVGQKFVYLVFEIGDISLNDGENCEWNAPEILYLESGDETKPVMEDRNCNDGMYHVMEDRYYYDDAIGLLKGSGLPVYSDKSIHTVGECARDVRWNVEGNETIHAGYLVDEDLLEQAYVCFRDGNGKIKFLFKISGKM